MRLHPGIFWLFLLAFLCHAFLLQTHVHAASAQIANRLSAPQQASHFQTITDSDDCPFCEEMGDGGLIVLPEAIAFPPPVFATRILFLAAMAVLAIGQRSHGWQSRAPPFLH